MYINEKLQEFERYINNKKVAVVGLGDCDMSLIDYLAEKGANVTVFDEREIDDIEKEVMNKITSRCIKFSLGKHCLVNLIGFDLIFRSPAYSLSCPEIQDESIRGAVVTSETELLIEMCPGTVIGVTGSKGKTTTVCLISDILKENGNICFSGVNNKLPGLSQIKDMQQDCFLVIELSDAHLMDIQSSPQIAIVTNIAEDGAEYINNLKNIVKYQNETDKAILNYDDENTKYLLADAKGKVKYFSTKTKLENGIIFDRNIIKSCVDGVRMHIISIDDAISIHGMHNYEDICAAVAATKDLVEPSVQARAIIKFKEPEQIIEKTEETSKEISENSDASENNNFIELGGPIVEPTVETQIQEETNNGI